MNAQVSKDRAHRAVIPKRKGQRTADRLAEVAFGLFESEGFENVTMERIAASAKVTRGTLYNHFAVKEALLDHYFRAEFETGITPLLADCARPPELENRLKRLFHAFSKWAAAHRKYIPYCLDYSLQVRKRLAEGVTPSGLQQAFSALLERAREKGELPPDADVAFLAEYLEHLYFAATFRWLASANDTSPRKECYRMLALFLRGAQASREKPRMKRA